jgi:hypothetical protein
MHKAFPSVALALSNYTRKAFLFLFLKALSKNLSSLMFNTNLYLIENIFLNAGSGIGTIVMAVIIGHFAFFATVEQLTFPSAGFRCHRACNYQHQYHLRENRFPVPWQSSGGQIHHREPEYGTADNLSLPRR